MNIEALHIGMKVRHPQYGVGMVKSLSEKTAEIAFDHAQRTIAPASSDLQPAEATTALSELEMPLATLIRDTAHAVVEAPWAGTKGRAGRTSGDSMAARDAGHAEFRNEFTRRGEHAGDGVPRFTIHELRFTQRPALRSPRSTSCSKTRTTSSAPAPRAAQWEGRMSE
jgi:hypothetical protein